MIPIGNARGGLYGVVGSGSFALLSNVGAWKSLRDHAIFKDNDDGDYFTKILKYNYY